MAQIETKEQAEKYLTLIGRRGKALELGREAIGGHWKTFDEINLQIRKHLLAYMFYRIFDNQMPNEPNLIAIWLRAEEKGLMRDLARTILNGDREWFEIICQKIREVADEVLKNYKVIEEVQYYSEITGHTRYVRAVKIGGEDYGNGKEGEPHMEHSDREE